MNGGFVSPTYDDWQARAGALRLKRSGRELVGPCPSCGGIDRFAVKPVEGGAAVIHCRQCKGFGDILRAAGFAEDRPTNGAAPPTTTYTYCDPSGAEYHRVYRQGDGPDKKVWQDKGHKGQFFPYRIEHAPDWGDRPVVVVEGEPCADHLATLGYATLSWNGGTNKVTRTRWGALAGRDAILWPDHDAPGLKAMQQLAEILDGLGCAVRWVSVPEGKPGGWDCADATDADAHRLIDAASANDLARPVEEMGRQIDEWPRAMTPGEFATADYPPPAWLLDGVLTANGVNLFVSKPDGGKSTTGRSLGFSVGRGETFLGRPTRQGPVWYGGFEEDPVRARLHLQAMGWDATVPIHPYIQFPPEELDPYEWLEAEIRRVKPVLVIVDTVSDLLKIEDESKYAEVRKKMRPLMAMSRQLDTCILLCHHTPKGQAHHWTDRVMGSQGFRGSVDTTLFLDWTDERRTLRSTQRYGDPMPETVLVLDPVTQRIESGGTVAADKARSLEDEVLAVVSDHDGPMAKTKIETEVGGNHARVRKALDRLCENGRLTSRKEGRSILYEYA